MKKTKVCKKCSIEKLLDSFPIAGKSGTNCGNGYVRTVNTYKSLCKECYRKREREKYHKLDEGKKEQRRKNNSCNNFEYRKAYKLRTKYGLTTEDFSAMIKEQNNKCKICDHEMEIPQVDHNHSTGKVRSLLCLNCNTSLGLLKENKKILYNMISYINDYL
jgi:hypothetical protein